MEQVFHIDISQRFKKWKKRMPSNARRSYAWLRQRAKRRPVTFPSAKNHSSVNAHVRLDASRSNWKQIYEKHKNGEPSFRVIRVHSALQVTGSQIGAFLRNTRPSSPGLDSTAPHEFKNSRAMAPITFRHARGSAQPNRIHRMLAQRFASGLCSLHSQNFG